MPKAKISITVDSSVASEIDAYFRKLVAEAAKSGKPIPKISNVYDEIVRKGWEAIRKERK